jgi:hypothetical protein
MHPVVCITTITFKATGFQAGRQVRELTQKYGLKEENPRSAVGAVAWVIR